MSNANPGQGFQVALPIVHFGEHFSLNVNTFACAVFPKPADNSREETAKVLVYIIGGYEPLELDGETARLFTAWFDEISGRGKLFQRIHRV
jgi:hypothetical protein